MHATIIIYHFDGLPTNLTSSAIPSRSSTESCPSSSASSRSTSLGSKAAEGADIVVVSWRVAELPNVTVCVDDEGGIVPFEKSSKHEGAPELVVELPTCTNRRREGGEQENEKIVQVSLLKFHLFVSKLYIK